MIPWEKEIIIFEEKIKPNMMEILRAGWIPSNDVKTWSEYITHEFQKNKLEHETLLLMLNVLASLKMSHSLDYFDGNIKDWYNLFITEIGKNYETDIYNLPTYITRHLMSLQNTNYLEQNSFKTNIKDFMNISNDKFYLEGCKKIKKNIFDESLLNIKHAYPTELMQRTLMPIYCDCVAARQFHRPILSRLNYGPLSKNGYHIIRNLQSHIKKKSKIMIKKRKLYGYSDISFMQTLDDITSTDGLIILIEYSEEFPPLLCQNGMNSKLIQFSTFINNDSISSNNVSITNNYNCHYPDIKNIKSNIPIQQIANKTYVNMNMPQYNIKNQNLNQIQKLSINNTMFKPIEKIEKDEKIKFEEYGKPMYITKTSPFLGNLKQGQILLAIENNLYRAPLYKHKLIDTDFLVIRNSGGYFIREFQALFVAGQEIPKKIVPVPGSKASTKYNRDLLQLYIYRSFYKSKDVPPRIKTDQIRRLFKHNSENAIRKRLKHCSDYKRNSTIPGEIGSWQLRSNFIIPSFDDLIKICKPEDACIYFSMISSERRLKDLGYNRKIYSINENCDEEELELLRGEDEILAAPWNTTRAYLDAIKCKCVLSINDGPADPTGKKLAFSYTKADSKIDVNSENLNSKTLINQTDLRKINMKVAKKYLIQFGMNTKKVEDMTRWEVVDTLKNLIQDEKNLPPMFQKYTRTTKILTPQSMYTFKKLCQKQFDIQNKLLSSNEQLISIINDNKNNSDSETIDNEKLGKDLEGFLNDIQIYDSSDESIDNDDINSNSETHSISSSKNNDINFSKLSKNIPSKLIIKRTFKNNDKTYERTEILTNPRIINAYKKTIRKNKILKEKIQDISKPKIKKLNLSKSINNIEYRDLRPNKINFSSQSNLYELNKNSPQDSINSDNNILKTNLSSKIPVKLKFNFDEPKKTEGIKIEGTKLFIGKSLLESSKDKKRNSILIKLSKDFPIDNFRKRKLSDNSEYFYKPFRIHGRRRLNPQVSLNVIFESIILELKKINDSWPFHQPVNSKIITDYYKIIKEPMDLSTIKDLTVKHEFNNRKEFFEKIKLIETNCILYNGLKSPLTIIAKNIVSTCESILNEKDDEIFILEKEINPLLDEDAQIPLSWIFENIISKIKIMNESYAFLKPVSIKLFPKYLDFVQTPMDLSLIKNNCHLHKYSNVDSFMYDVRLIHENSIKFNGPDHNVSKMANIVVQKVEQQLLEMNEHIQHLQNEISSQPEHLKNFYQESRNTSLHGKKLKNNLIPNIKDKINFDPDSIDILKDLEMSDDE